MLYHFKTQEELDHFNELLKIEIESLTVVQAEDLVAEIYSLLPDKHKSIFSSEWSKYLIASIAIANGSVQAHSSADVAVIAYARRFFKS